MSKLVIIAVAIIAVAYIAMPSNDAAMTQCQAKGFSFDTCFHSLNR